MQEEKQLLQETGEDCCCRGEVVEQVNRDMPDEDSLYRLAELFKLFGDPTRMKILCALFESEMCVCHLAQLLGVSQSAVSHQLRVLKAGKLVRPRREGKTVYYALDDEHVRKIIAQGMEHIQE